MDVLPVRRCSQQVIDTIVGSVNLLRQIQQHDPEQFAFLMQYSQMVDLQAGEQVIESGQIDTWLYFLIKGRLSVFAGEPMSKLVNSISPGEMFGDMAVLMHQPRVATIIADQEVKATTVLRVDFSIFGDPEEIQNVSLYTKLLFYRAMVHNLRWRIESYRNNYPDIAANFGLTKVNVFSGSKETLDELLSLDTQAQQLSEMLEQWNSRLSA